MKKLITLCLFAFTFILGTPTLVAQEQDKVIDENAKIQSSELQKILGLDDDQTAMVWRAIYSTQKIYIEHVNGKDQNDQSVADLKAKADLNFKSQMVKILTEEQFAKYSDYLAKNNSKE
jgi:hypothetical protein